MLRATEMGFWQRSAGISRRERICNEKVREIMDVENDIVHDIVRYIFIELWVNLNRDFSKYNIH